MELKYRKTKLEINEKHKEKLEECERFCEHYLELCALDAHTPDLLLLLEKEIEEKAGKKFKDKYRCPHCDFVSPFFNIVNLHMIMDMNCSERDNVQPCYPILIS